MFLVEYVMFGGEKSGKEKTTSHLISERFCNMFVKNEEREGEKRKKKNKSHCSLILSLYSW